MILRHPSNGQKLDVAGLNEITVLIDRSETELTEVAINSWTPGLDGPPHAHDRKEQNFLVTAGRGEVVIGRDRFTAAPGDFFYVPAGLLHQTINRDPDGRLEYFLFNAFLDKDKEGHASFADHIDKVKATRRQQADTQRQGNAPAGAAAAGRRGKHAVLSQGCAVKLLGRDETERCESISWRLTASEAANIDADAAKEQTLYVVSGKGSITVDGETAEVRTGHTIFVPRNASSGLRAGSAGLEVVSFGTVVDC